MPASTQNQALCALLFLYRQVPGRPFGPLAGEAWAKKGTNVPVVLSPHEVAGVFDHLCGVMSRICRDARWGPPSRYRLHESAVQRAVAEAAKLAQIDKRVSCHVFRHKDVSTTMVYTHVLNRGAMGVRSPADGLPLKGVKAREGTPG